MGVETEVTSTSTRLVENVVIKTKGLHDRNNLLLNRRTVENKRKIILMRIWVDSFQDRDYWGALLNAALDLQIP